jgi:hypothetical protein
MSVVVASATCVLIAACPQLAAFMWPPPPLTSLASPGTAVTRFDDPGGAGACPADCSLRQALASIATGGTVTLPPGTYVLTQGALALGWDVEIDGAGARTTTIVQTGRHRVIEVDAGTITITNVTITGGSEGLASSDRNPGVGGGIWIDLPGSLTLIGATVSGNHADQSGGGIDVDGALTVSGSTISGNTTSGGLGIGGGIDGFGANLTVTNSTIAGNTASGDGGGLLIASIATLTNVTIAGNSTGGRGGGVGIHSGAMVETLGSLFAANAGGNCGAALVSDGHNLSSDATCGLFGAGDLMSIDPELGPLQNNGGSTNTLALAALSPAVDAGADAGCPATDQRGVPRPQGTHCDVGAYEFQPGPTATTTTVSSAANPSAAGQAVTFTATVSGAGGTPTGAVQFTVDGTDLGAPVALPAVAASPGNLVVNGSFEDGLTSWVSVDSSFLFEIPSGAYVGSVAQDGNTFVTEQFHTADLYQDVSGLVVGNIYTLSFYLAPWIHVTDPGNSLSGFDQVSSIQVTLADPAGGSSLQQTFTAPLVHYPFDINPLPSVWTPWTLQTWTFIAIAPTMRLAFTDPFDTPGAPQNDPAFDNVVISGVPPGSATVTSPAATSLTSGAYTIGAVYSGDATFGGSSGSLTQTVGKVDTTTNMTSSLNPSFLGQAVTFSATVASVSPGSGTPTGTVTFLDGATTLGTATLSGGTATFSTKALSAASHSITAAYGGDASFNGNTSSAVAQTVQPSVVVVNVTETIGVHDVLTPLLAAMINVAENIGVHDSPDLSNTPTGTTVVVQPVDTTTGATPVSLTFSSVTKSGESGVSTGASGPPLPAGYEPGSPLTYFEISTTALFSGPVSVCINYAGIVFTRADLSLMHFENGAWVDRTASVNLTAHQICATVVSFSPFVIVQPADRAPVLANPGDQTSDEGQAVSLQLIATDADHDALTYSATGLPPGLHLSPAGVMNGTPTDQSAGRYAVTVNVSDGTLSAAQSFTWTVIDMSGRMIGDGEVGSGGLEDRFTFIVTERRNGADYGHVEVWIREPDTPRKPGRELDRLDASTITAVTFSNDPGFKPGRQTLPTVDTVAFSGSGAWNGRAGYTFAARATDQGEPGAGDTFAIAIRDPRGTVVASISGTLAAGNIQSLRLQGR